MKQLQFQRLPLLQTPWSSSIEFKRQLFSMTDQCVLCSDYTLNMALERSSPKLASNVSDSEHNTQSNTCYGTVIRMSFLDVLSPAKSLRLATAYTSHDAADTILRRLTAYEVCGGLWRLTAAARGSTYRQHRLHRVWRNLTWMIRT